MTLHVLPLNDRVEHTTDGTCRCQPLFVSTRIVVHHAYDLREAQERQGRTDENKKWAVVEVENLTDAA